MQLKKELESAVSNIIKAFEKKQGLCFEFFVGDDVTGIACFSNEYYINLTDICHDVFTEQPKGLIIEWQENTIAYQEKKGYINYQHYCMGARYNNSKEKIVLVCKDNCGKKPYRAEIGETTHIFCCENCFKTSLNEFSKSIK